MTSVSMAVLLAVVCGSGCRKPDNATPTVSVGSAVVGVLELGDMKLVDTKANYVVLINANGEVRYQHLVLAKVSADGTMKDANGEVSFTLQADGTIKGRDGKPISITLSPDAVLRSGDQTISVDATGKLVADDPMTAQMKIEGADTPGKRRTALFVLHGIATTPLFDKAGSATP